MGNEEFEWLTHLEVIALRTLVLRKSSCSPRYHCLYRCRCQCEAAELNLQVCCLALTEKRKNSVTLWRWISSTLCSRINLLVAFHSVFREYEKLIKTFKSKAKSVYT